MDDQRYPKIHGNKKRMQKNVSLKRPIYKKELEIKVKTYKYYLSLPETLKQTILITFSMKTNQTHSTQSRVLGKLLTYL